MYNNFIYLNLIIALCSIFFNKIHSQDNIPRIHSLDVNELELTKKLIDLKSPDVMPAYNSLIKEAEKYMKLGPYSVMKKEITPPSGDKHDYLSLSIYSWPNPKTKDGLPYITKDGQVNPESKKGNDAVTMVRMCEFTFSLALAYFFSKEEKFASRAAELLRVWFLNPATKMNPNLKYAQLVRGKNQGSPGGIIDSRNLINVVEAAELIESSNSWSEEDKKELIKWFKEYLEWLLTSDNGIAEGKTKNNHLTFYKAQVINFALFTGDNEEASKQFESIKELISSQIEPDGSQPLELKRAKSFSYSIFNLQAFFLLAEMGRNSNIDLYSFQTADGRSIKKALDFIIPYIDTTIKWPYKEIGSISEGMNWIDELLRLACLRYNDNKYEGILKKNFDSMIKTKKFNLLYPIQK